MADAVIEVADYFAIVTLRMAANRRLGLSGITVFTALWVLCGARGQWYGTVAQIINTIQLTAESNVDKDNKPGKGYKERMIQYALRKLEAEGYIATADKQLPDGNIVKEYFIIARTRQIPPSPLKNERTPVQKIAPGGAKNCTNPAQKIAPKHIDQHIDQPNISLATSQATPQESAKKEVTKVYTCPSCGRTFESGDEDFLEKHLVDCDGMDEDTKVSPAKGRPFNDAEKIVYAALAACFGAEPRTSRERKKWEIATREIAAGGYGSRDVHTAYRRWHEKFKDGGCTPFALSGHMQELLDLRSGYQRLAVLPPTVGEIQEKLRSERVKELTEEEKAQAAAIQAELKRKQALRKARQAANLAAYERIESEAQ